MIRARPRVSLALKFVFAAILIIASLSSVTSFLFIRFEEENLRAGLKEKGILLAKNLASNSERGLIALDEESLMRALQKAADEEYVAYAVVQDARGNIAANLQTDPSAVIPKEIESAIAGNALSARAPLVQEFVTDIFDERFYEIAAPIRVPLPEREGIFENVGAARVGISLRSTTELIEERKMIAVFASLFMIGISIIFSGILAGFMLNPVRKLLLGTYKVAEGDLDHRININSKDELGILAQSFNKMIADLRRSRQELDGWGRNLEVKVEERARELKESKLYLENVLGTMTDGLMVLDREGNIRDANKALQSLTGFNRHELIDQRAVSFLFSNDRANAIEAIGIALKHGSVRNFELRLSSKKGKEEIPVHFSGAVLKGDSGSVQGLVAVLHDMTRERELDKMKSEFTSLVSHELNTPLTSIQGFVYLMLSGKLGAISDEQKKHLEVVYRQSMHLKSLIGSLLDFSMLETGRFEITREKFNIAESIGAALESFEDEANSRNITVRFEGKNDILNVLGDKDKIERVIANLLGNALRFTPKGGSVRISAHKNPDMVEVIMEDAGIGIDKESLTKIFEKFYQVDASLTRTVGGIGMGLPLSKAIIESHGGVIRAESAGIGKGSKFIFSVPAAK